jgi:hypothetical protein
LDELLQYQVKDLNQLLKLIPVEVLEQKQVQFGQIPYMMYQFLRYNVLNIFHYDQVQLMEYEVYVNAHQFDKV